MKDYRNRLTWLLLVVFLFVQVIPVTAGDMTQYQDPNANSQPVAPTFTNNSSAALSGATDQLANYYFNQYKNGLGWDWLQTTNISFSAFSGNTPQWNLNTFQPLSLKGNLDNFLFMQGQYGTGNNTVNVGLGYRTMNAEHDSMYGVNLFYDWQTTVQGENGYNPSGMHMRLGAGLEYFTGSIESRLNAYFGGLTGDVQVGYKDPYSGQAAFQAVAPGLDFTVGTDFSFWDAPWLKLAATGNWYSQQHGGTINGYNGSPLYATINAYLQVTPQLQINGGGSFGSGNPSNGNIGFQFNLLAPPQPALVMGDPVINDGAKTDISYKMLQPVQRNNTITVERYIKQLAPDLITVAVNVVNSNGNAVPGAIVTLAQQSATATAAATAGTPSPIISDSNGQAKFTVLPGSWQAWAQIGATGEKVSAAPLTSNDKQVRFDLYGGYTLVGASLPEGTITVYDQHGNAVDFSYDLGNPLYRDSGGNPVLLGLKPGEKYTLKIVHDGVTDVIYPDDPTSNQPDKPDAEVIDLSGKITASGKGSITAQVTYSDGKTPRSGKTVSLLQNGTVINSITTKADGYAAFSNLAYGSYTVSYNNDAEERTEAATISVSPPGVNLTLPTQAVAPDPNAVGAIKTGLIKYADGNELADGAMLKILGQPDGTPVYTAAYAAGNGVTFGELPYGTYVLYAEVPGQGYVAVTTTPAPMAPSGENKNITLTSATLPGNKPVTGNAQLTLTANGAAAQAGTKYVLTDGLNVPTEWYTLGSSNVVSMKNLLAGGYWYFYMKSAVTADGTINGSSEWVQKAMVNQDETVAVNLAGQYLTTTVSTRNMDGTIAANTTVHVAQSGFTAESANDITTGIDGTTKLNLWQASTGVTGKYDLTATIGGVDALTGADAATQPAALTLQPVSGAALTVNVKDSVTAAAVSGAEVKVILSGSAEEQTQTTGGSGQVLFNVANGSYNVTVTKAGYTQQQVVRVINGVAKTAEIAFVKITKADVAFTVTNPNTSNMVSGATITLTGTGQTYNKTTDASGQATFTDIPNGTYGYAVDLDGYSSATGSITVDGIALSQAVNLNELTGKLSGKATAGSSTVTVDLWKNGKIIATTTTDDEGNYEFTGVLSGTYTVQFSADDYNPASVTDYVQSINLEGELAEVTLAEVKGSIAGTVSIGSGAMAGATVQLTDENGTAIGSAVTTDSEGKYDIFVNSGTYKVKVTKDNYQDYLSVIINQGVNVATTHNVTLSETAGTASGTVKVFAPGGGLIPVAAVTVTLCDSTGEPVTPAVSTATDVNGLFTLSPVVSGTYKLKGSKTGYTDLTGDAFTQTINQAKTGLALEGMAEKSGSISGTIKDGATALAGATVTLSNANFTSDKVYTTTADGTYTFSGSDILSGGYTLKVEKATYTTYSDTFTQGVNETRTFDVNMSLLPITVSGTAYGEDGTTAVQGITATLYDSAGTTPVTPTVTATSSANGSYTLTVVPGPGYTIRYTGTDYETQTGASFATTPGTNISGKNVTMLEVAGSVGGTITSADHTGTALNGMTAELYQNGITTGKTATTDANGQYTISGVKSGAKYVVKVTDPNGTYTDFSGAEFTQGVHETSTDENYALSEVTGSIAGTVTSSDGGTISGLAIVLQDASGNTISGVTINTNGGTYTITGVKSGTYKVQASATGCETAATNSFAQPVKTATTGVNITLATNPDISGTFSGLPDRVTPTITVSPVSGTVTVNAANKTYKVTDVAPDTTYTVTATYANYTAAAVSVAVDKVNVTAPAISFALEDKLVVNITGFAGAAPAGATIMFAKSGSAAVSKTITGNGTMRFTTVDLPLGTYSLSGSASGYTFAATPSDVTLRSSGTVTASLVAMQTLPYAVTINVKDSSGYAIGQATVTCSETGAVATTNALGVASFTVGTYATYNFTAVATGYVANTCAVAVSSSSSSGNIALAAAGGGYALTVEKVMVTETVEIDTGDTIVLLDSNYNYLKTAQYTRKSDGGSGAVFTGLQNGVYYVYDAYQDALGTLYQLQVSPVTINSASVTINQSGLNTNVTRTVTVSVLNSDGTAAAAGLAVLANGTSKGTTDSLGQCSFVLPECNKGYTVACGDGSSYIRPVGNNVAVTVVLPVKKSYYFTTAATAVSAFTYTNCALAVVVEGGNRYLQVTPDSKTNEFMINGVTINQSQNGVTPDDKKYYNPYTTIESFLAIVKSSSDTIGALTVSGTQYYFYYRDTTPWVRFGSNKFYWYYTNWSGLGANTEDVKPPTYQMTGNKMYLLP